MKRALLVGIDDYIFAPLKGCINDATQMKTILSQHYDGSPNFSCKLLTSASQEVTRAKLSEEIHHLFSFEGDVALFYFSGHGCENMQGGALATQDAARYSEGVLLSEVITLANQNNKIKEVILILDCCHSGQLGDLPQFSAGTALLRKGLSVLTASQTDQYAMEVKGQGLFTSILLDGLQGGASSLTGEVTAASLYNYVEKILGPWDQRPIFKAHLSALNSIRTCEPKIYPPTLRKIVELFPEQDTVYPLDPAYEPTVSPKDEEKETLFRILQKYHVSGLVQPDGAQYMYYAALHSLSCSLTPLGQFYWKMVRKGRI